MNNWCFGYAQEGQKKDEIREKKEQKFVCIIPPQKLPFRACGGSALCTSW